MTTMDPGPDGEAWWLCAKCWLEGVRPKDQFGDEPAKKEPKVVVVSPEVGDALQKSGWNVTDAAPDAQRTTKPRKKRKPAA